jgi:hypothetical protein
MSPVAPATRMFMSASRSLNYRPFLVKLFPFREWLIIAERERERIVF